MARQLPTTWKSLSVKGDLGVSGDFPANLTIFKVARTNNLLWRFLPEEINDPRPHQGRTNNGKGKRKWIEGTTGVSADDPVGAGKEAKKRAIAKQQELQRQKEEEQFNSNHALVNYWETWFSKECKDQSRRNPDRWRTDTLNKWEGTNGIKFQPFARKRVDLITTADFKDYFSLITETTKTRNGTTGEEAKAQRKTLIRHLLNYAKQNDFPHYIIPDFPSISKQAKQVIHLRKEEWELLLQKVIELSGGQAKKQLTKKQYEELEWSPNRNKTDCQRSWVDLFDALLLQWFFYLRAEDMPRLKSEWFVERSDDEIVCLLEETKGDREIFETENYRPDAYNFCKRLKKRRPTGYLVLPHLERKVGRPTKHVGQYLRDLLLFALDECGISTDGKNWTTIRHTALRLTLEEYPDFGKFPDIRRFADNAHTSVEMLQERYLRFIGSKELAKKARRTIKPSTYTLTKRVET